MKHKVKAIQTLSEDMHLIFVEKKPRRVQDEPDVYDYNSIASFAHLT